MIDRSNLILHQSIKNIKQYYDCLGNTFIYDYEIMIDKKGNVCIERITSAIEKNNYSPKKEVLVEINDNVPLHKIVLELYKEILASTETLLQEPLEIQLQRIISLKNTDPLLLQTYENEIERCSNKMNNYKIQCNISKELLKTYQTKIQELKQIIEANKYVHNDEIQKLMNTISTIYKHL